jgi:hypothetical protein
MEYVRNFEDVNGDGYPDVPEKYSKKLGRIVCEPSLNPVSILKKGTWITWCAFGAVLVIAAGAAFVTRFIVMRVRRRAG